MLDFLKRNGKISQEEEKLIAKKMEESLNIFPEVWYVADIAYRHPNIEKNVSKEVLTEWLEKTFGVFTVTPYSVMDEWLKRVNMPENVQIHIGTEGLTIEKEEISYSYSEWGRLQGKKTPKYTLKLVDDNSMYFGCKEQNERIAIRGNRFEAQEIAMLEAIMQTILEKEKKWDLFTIVKTIKNILGESYQVSLIAEDGKVIEECTEEVYYKNGTEFSIQNQENWEARKGLITTVCIKEKKSSYIEIGNRRIEVTTQIAQERIEDIFTRYKKAKSYRIEQIVPILAYDVLYVKEEAIKIKGEKDIKSFFSIVKVLPTEFSCFLRKCGIYNQVVEMDRTELYVTGENEKKMYIQSYGKQGIGILYEDGYSEIEVKYAWQKDRFERKEISVKIGAEGYREERYREEGEDVTFYERSYPEERYCLIVKEKNINRNIRECVLTVMNEGTKSLKELQNISKDIMELSCSDYQVQYYRDYKVISINTKDGRTYFYQYPKGAWSLERDDSVILSDGSFLQKNQELAMLSEEEIKLLYETVIVPLFLKNCISRNNDI